MPALLRAWPRFLDQPAKRDPTCLAEKAIARDRLRESARSRATAKALTGDEDPVVLADCLAGLLSVEPDESPAFVARFLEAADEALEAEFEKAWMA